MVNGWVAMRICIARCATATVLELQGSCMCTGVLINIIAGGMQAREKFWKMGTPGCRRGEAVYLFNAQLYFCSLSFHDISSSAILIVVYGQYVNTFSFKQTN